MTHPARAHDRRWFSAWPRVVDDGRGLTRNFCATLRYAASVGAEWTLLAQDDVEPCRGLDEGLTRWLGEAPASVVAAFSMGRVRDAACLARGLHWRRRRRGELIWVMLVAVRTSLVGRIADAVEQTPRRANHGGVRHQEAGCDERLSIVLDAFGLAAVTHLPNLVQHRGKSSLVGHGWTVGGHPRVSPTFQDGATMERLCGWDGA